MTDPEAARRDAFEDDVRTALFRPVALALWLLAIIISAIARSTLRSR